MLTLFSSRAVSLSTSYVKGANAGAFEDGCLRRNTFANTAVDVVGLALVNICKHVETISLVVYAPCFFDKFVK